jgi:hypothetical protein
LKQEKAPGARSAKEQVTTWNMQQHQTAASLDQDAQVLLTIQVSVFLPLFIPYIA